MANRNRDEKDEKDLRKHDEKSAEEKSWDEKWRRDPISGIVWACILIWAGLIFLAENLGLLDSLTDALPGEPSDYADFNAWSLIFLGAGIILLAEVVVRLALPEHRQSITGTLIFAVILIGIGLGDLISSGVVWALIIIAIGVTLLLRGLMSNR